MKNSSLNEMKKEKINVMKLHGPASVEKYREMIQEGENEVSVGIHEKSDQCSMEICERWVIRSSKVSIGKFWAFLEEKVTADQLT